MSFETPEALAEELILFTDNDGDINRSQTRPILKNLMTKIGQGKYDHDRAVDLFMYLAEAGAKKYAREFGGPGTAWHQMFPINIRRMAATHWRDEFEANAKSGEYDSLLPKKYQKTSRQTTVASVSTAYLSGQKDANAWIRSADPSPSVLRVLIARDPTTMNPSQELARDHSAAKVAKKLGVTVKSVTSYDPHFNHAVKEYDAGYLRVCQLLLNAMEGN